ncbi:MAG TPA: glycoside hydrolase family 2 TIM barrel-domain containing protein [Terracidiphilus sp.]|nr:glycoside hydrolase family 2 TIM barrel-domain containing protein [Terracidiphilus sp.]
MEKDNTFTRREALQGLMGVTAAAMLPAAAMTGQEPADSATPWLAAAPAPNRLQAFNDDWRFTRGDVAGADAAEFDDSRWRMLDVPHDWSIEDLPQGASEPTGAVWAETNGALRTGPFDMYASEGQSATGWTVGGIGCYRKRFARPQVPPGGKAELRFDGVYMNCDVWMNGAHLGNHPYGYTEFAFEITPHLRDGENTVAVRVNNNGRNSRWYSGSGIFRKVWLSVAGPLRIPTHGVSITTPQASSDSALVNIAVTVENGAAAAANPAVRARLLDASGTVAGEAQKRVRVPAGAGATATCTVRLNTPRLWSPADPHLYRAEVVVESDGQLADAAALYAGVRTVEIDAEHGLRINGASIKLHGGCAHHANGPLGSASIPRADERRVELLKASGFNAIRTSHNPPSPAFLDACDRLGMLVIDEAFDCWEEGKNPQDYHLYFKDWWQRDLASMILRDRNHPSVILWSIGNEIPERATPEGVQLGQEMAAYVYHLDPTRKVTAAINGPYGRIGQTWKDMQPAFTYLGVGGYNYQWEQYEKDHAGFPERVMVGTESFPEQAYQNWHVIDNSSWVIGDFVWTAIDYLGESGIGHSTIQRGPGQDSFNAPFPWFNSYCGDIDLIGNKKPQSYFRDVVWRRSQVEMAVQRPIPKDWAERISRWGWSDELRSWTWPGQEGSPMTVRVYTRGDSVRLLLNGKEVGSNQLSASDALRTEFTVLYAPGELKAVAYRNGQEIGTIAFTTVGKPRSLRLAPDRKTIRASRDDLSYVMVTVLDENGQPVPDAVIPVSFTVSGAGEIAAVGNADPRDMAGFRQPQRNTFHGQCVAILRPTGQAGTIHLRAESPGLGASTAEVRVS